MLRKFLDFGVPTLVLVALLMTSCQVGQPATLQSTAEAAPTEPPTVSAPTATASPMPTIYGWRGTELTIIPSLPQEPAQAMVFEALPEVPASLEYAQALADQFDMQGQLYQAQSEPGAFLFADGNRRLVVHAQGRFTYYPQVANYWNFGSGVARSPEAEQQIADFMTRYSFDMDYRIVYSEIHAAYYALPSISEGNALHFDHFRANGMLFEFNEDGIVSVNATLVDFESLGTFVIISAEGALQKILEPNSYYGSIESGHAISLPFDSWVRQYAQDETATIYGWMNSTPSLEGGDPLVTLDGYTATGDLNSIDATMPNTFVEATGQFHTEQGVDTFVLESWKRHRDSGEGLFGTLEQRGDQVVMVTMDGAEVIIPDVPAGVPLPLESVYILGVTVGDTFEWNTFDLRAMSSGGGGGGGSLYTVNLSGTPNPMPTEDATASGLPAVGEALESQRGILSVTFYTQPGGSQRAEYQLFYVREGDDFSVALLLQGDGLDELESMHNKPIEVSGRITGTDPRGFAIATVESFTIPFPDLEFHVYKGTQSEQLVAGKPAVLFTTGGVTYVQMASWGNLDGSLLGPEGGPVLLEGLLIPNETYGGYPVLRIFSASMATNPVNGEPYILEVTADQIPVMEPQPDFEIPTASIETVELVYFIPEPGYVDPNNGLAYIQPMWRFVGHYSSGDEFEIMVQALQPEFLSPEIMPIEPPG